MTLLLKKIEKQRKNLKVFLKYVDGESVIHELNRVSKPSRRFYLGVNNIKPVIGGLGYFYSYYRSRSNRSQSSRQVWCGR